MTKPYPKLRDINAQIEEELKKVGSNISSKGRRTHKRATLFLVMQNYSEVLQILKRIQDQQERFKKLQKRYSLPKIRKKFGAGPITDKRVEKALSEQHEITSSVKLDIKSLYIWVHQIKDVFYRCQVGIDLSELRRIAFLRNKFLTHIAETELFKESKFTQGGFIFDSDLEKMEILFHSIFSPENKRKKFSVLVKKARVHIPELRNEKNLFEQAAIVYSNLNTLAHTGCKEEAEKFLETVGLRTEPPGKIAVALLAALREYKKVKRL